MIDTQEQDLPAIARIPDSQSLLSVIARAAADPAVDVTKMEALLRMQKELIADQARAQFNEAFARLQMKLPRVKKNGEVRYPVNKNNPDGPTRHAFNYARWEDIDEAIRPLLNEEGFSFSVDTQPHSSGGILGTGTLMHVGGHSRSASFGPVPLDTSGGKNNLQAAGSTTSYIARNTAKMLLNLVFEGEDDDGVAGGRDPITAEQVKELSDLLRETGSDLDSYCRLLGVAALPDIEKSVFTVARNALNARKNSQARRQ